MGLDGKQLLTLTASGLLLSGCGGANRQTPNESPKQPPKLVDVALGEQHACVRTVSGRVLCWGNNGAKQLGRVLPAGRRSSTIPAPVTALPAVEEVALGANHSCARTKTGAVYCWGSNVDGQGGRKSARNTTTPIRVQGLPRAKEIVAGNAFTCARLVEGDTWCWGHYQNPTFEQKQRWVSCRNCGTPSVGRYGSSAARGRPRRPRYVDVLGRPYRFSSKPTRIGIGPATKLATTSDFACALARKGGVTCHGLQTPGNMTPKIPANAHSFTDFDVAAWAGCGVRPDKAVLCWSAGNRTWVPQYRVEVVRLGKTQACVLSKSKVLRCWPRQQFASDQATLANISTTLSNVVAFQVSGDHGCALSQGRIYCWGPPGNLVKPGRSRPKAGGPSWHNHAKPVLVPLVAR